jgi:hypothetical protein
MFKPSNCIRTFGIVGFAAILVLPAASVATASEKVIHSFRGSDGAYLFGGLITDGAGNLLGVAGDGGGGAKAPAAAQYSKLRQTARRRRSMLSRAARMAMARQALC